MILIADSGSTKTDWCVVENGVLIQQIFTKGTNPFFQSEEEISNEIATALLPQLKTSELDAVYFYGAGCGFPDKIAMVHRAITKHLRVKGEVEVNTDMLAAARGLCQHDAGIACIMVQAPTHATMTASRLYPTYLHWDSSSEMKAAAPYWASCW